MAIGGFPGNVPIFGGTVPPQPFDRARRDGADRLPQVPQNPPAGSLVVVDSFQDNWAQADHGNIGTYAAKEHGFRGNVYAENIGPDIRRMGVDLDGAFADYVVRPLSTLVPVSPALDAATVAVAT